jgi:hypothetical protein
MCSSDVGLHSTLSIPHLDFPYFRRCKNLQLCQYQIRISHADFVHQVLEMTERHVSTRGEKCMPFEERNTPTHCFSLLITEWDHWGPM